MLKSFSLVLVLGLIAIGVGQTFAANCPANSHVASSGNSTVNCVCNAGYVYSGGQCVPAR
jgi:hypothetical protein